MKNEINHTWFFPHSPEKVWDYLTKPELLEQWLMPNDIKPVLGHKFMLTSKTGIEHHCEIVEVKPFTRLSYSWQRKSIKDGKPFDSTVVWTLVPKDKGTELQLVHKGFTAMEDYEAHNKGWSMLGKLFVELLNMGKNATGQVKDTIKHTYFFPHPAELIWKYLTTPELLEKWLMPNDIKPVVGHKFMFTTDPMPKAGFDGKVYCEILEVLPFKKLSYSWKGGTGPGKLDTIAIWTLTPKDNGTELILEHRGFNEENGFAYEAMNMGWAKISDRILTLISEAKHE